MSSSFSAPVSAAQVGSFFVGQYYNVLQQQPDSVYQFYDDASKVVRVDGDSSQTAATLMDIHNLISSANFTSVEIKTINSLESWNGGIMVMVSGSVKSKDFSGRRKFVQAFFLAPQERGYFVMSDIFQYVEDGAVSRDQLPVSSENKFDVQINASSPQPEPPVPDYALEEEAREYVSSVNIEDDPVDKHSLSEQYQQTEGGVEVAVEEPPAVTYTSIHDVVNAAKEPPAVTVEEAWEEPQKKTYASILRVARGQSALPVVSQQPSFRNKSSIAFAINHSQPTTQLSNPGSSFAPESGSEPVDGGYSVVDEGEPKSVYVKNLPFSITPIEIEQEFKKFGRIKPDGVFIREQKDVASPYVYAFVEFEELPSVYEAIKASPIQLAGSQVYIEERRPNRFSSFRGGRRGRGRGSYNTEATRGRFGGRGLGRGGSYDAGDYNGSRGYGGQQRGSR